MKYALFLCLGLISTRYSAQVFSFQAGIGTHLFNKNGIGISMNLGANYDINKIFGLRIDYNFDKAADDIINRGGIQANFHLIPLIKKRGSYFGLDLHSGIGVVNNSNEIFSDDKFIRGDDMIDFIIGLTPTYRINKQTRVTLDFTLHNLSKIDGDLKNYGNLVFGIRRVL
jgi:hypothetical protein